MLSRKNKLLVMKIISLFSVVRGYNIPIIVLAQYLSAIFILAPNKRALEVLLDVNLFLIVFLSSLTIASGYIINNFYDNDKDLINRPNKSMLDRLVSQKTKLYVYFSINFIVFLLAFFISFRAVLFFSIYIFLIWFYSHKLKKMVVIGNLFAAFLAVLPFFAILLYYKNLYPQIFAHATFLYLLLLIREMIKDLENLKGDIANDYKTIPVLFGEKISKQIISFLTFGTIIPVYYLVTIFEVGYMDIYFYLSLIVLLFFLQLLWKSNDKSGYLKLHNILKFLIVSGVFCIVLIEPEVLIHGKRLLKL
ncbi:MAG TPA: geranylgeranylglycerol-phosphate geranylgeranyltransferase [Flavobacterium sp.]|jgi:4-hydroxybenzoate polyprenyltransferase|uniref:geranylgeranylglycerol-phosphate geranylgeranyltransferase n=1 Tax=Flavobacterium sp. TaxID=239 RepID=UPI002C099398|nr:geranylgeranylglycerol-phosphate geranylgeranyltransferase [Flavobacterium sp.]MCA0349370.1 geranylgeranylglycerol-phosphate geranylgeranyltransferase [Bacteroidota bacterium]HPW98656.1 geranylgeranylglycerol-phosphate geranylgeranyltransferase [Flavobacterium sp.]HQA75035.1 geranylgeranylglycerol-phosphate geranylgeranyltransferase [Flavobacterium sp.]